MGNSKQVAMSPLEAWLYILDTANEQKISVEEVIVMNETLRNTVEYDPGLTQFIKSYDIVTADDKLRQEYDLYARGILYYNGTMRMAYEEGEEKGIEQGIEQGINQEKLSTARNLIDIGMSEEQIAKVTALPLETIRGLSANP
jgi:predicted transposase/invertase (TIGR01784 family)